MQPIIIFLFSFIMFTATFTSTNNQQTQPFITEPSSLTPWQGSRSCMSKNTQMQLLPTSGDMVVKVTFHDLSFNCLSTCLSLRQGRPACDWDEDLRRALLVPHSLGFQCKKDDNWQVAFSWEFSKNNNVTGDCDMVVKMMSHDSSLTEAKKTRLWLRWGGPSWCHTGFPIEEGWQVAFSLGTPRHNNGAVSIQYSQSSVIHDYIYQAQQRTVQNPGFFHFHKVTRLSIWLDARLAGLVFEWQFLVYPRKIYPRSQSWVIFVLIRCC